MKSIVITYGFIVALMFSLSNLNVINEQVKYSTNSQLDSERVSNYLNSDETSFDNSNFEKRINNLVNLDCPDPTTFNQLISSNNFYPEQLYALSDNNRRT